MTDYEGLWLLQLMAREAIFSTAVGDGIALPHARDPAAPSGRNGLSIGTSRMGVDFDAPDGRPVHLFVVLCADSSGSGHETEIE